MRLGQRACYGIFKRIVGYGLWRERLDEFMKIRLESGHNERGKTMRTRVWRLQDAALVKCLAIFGIGLYGVDKLGPALLFSVLMFLAHPVRVLNSMDYVVPSRKLCQQTRQKFDGKQRHSTMMSTCERGYIHTIQLGPRAHHPN